MHWYKVERNHFVTITIIFVVAVSDCRIKRHRRCSFESKDAFGSKHFTSSYQRFSTQPWLFLILNCIPHDNAFYEQKA